MTLRYFVPVLIAGVTLASCNLRAGRDPAAGIDCSTITLGNTDDCIRLNEIQVLGTHNSYHIAPPPALLTTLGKSGRDREYTHRLLTEQLSQLGIRQFELDVFADPNGGRFARPAGLRMTPGLEPLGRELLAPGFKVLHTQDFDYLTTCSTLIACLTTIRDWSKANPWHVPIMVQIEAKDAVLDDPRGVGFVKPIPIGAAEFRALDEEIKSVFDAAEVPPVATARSARERTSSARTIRRRVRSALGIGRDCPALIVSPHDAIQSTRPPAAYMNGSSLGRAGSAERFPSSDSPSPTSTSIAE